MEPDGGESAQHATSPGLGTLLVGCFFLLAGLTLAGYGLFAFLFGSLDYDQSNTWLGLFTAVGGGQVLATYALMARGIPEFDFWQVEAVRRAAARRDRLLVWLQIPFQAGALLGIALYVMFSPGGYIPGYLLALSVAVAIISWNTYRAQASAGAHLSLYLLAAVMVVRFVWIAVG